MPSPTETWHAVEVAFTGAAGEAAGEAVLQDIRDLGITTIRAVRTSLVYLLDADLTREQLDLVAQRLLADPVAQTYHLGEAPVEAADAATPIHVLRVLRKPGVMEPAEASALKAIADLGLAARAFRIARKYVLEGTATDADLDLIAGKVLANETIEEVHRGTTPLAAPAPARGYVFQRAEVPLRTMSDDEMLDHNRRHLLSLSLAELTTIRDHFADLGRDPTDVELETLAQTWSEHCVHKTFKGVIEYTEGSGVRGQGSGGKGPPSPGAYAGDTDAETDEGWVRLVPLAACPPVRQTAGTLAGTPPVAPTRVIDSLLASTVARVTRELDKPWCISVFVDNAGVIEFDDEHAICFKVETHNHPSAIEPYGGAGTGTGGVIRDPLGTGLGAKPVANTDIFCFGPWDLPFDQVPKGALHPKRVMKGVVAGVRDYGNRMGIPTVNGAVYFDERYVGNPLVYCGTVGLLPREMCFGEPRAGDAIVLVGGRTGRDGIHGVTFASIELTDESETLSSGAVQIGNPITEKKMVDTLIQARDAGLYSAITDCGGGGLSSAVGEMGEHLGLVVDLDRVPLKYQGLSYTEIWISEAQERMLLAVPPENETSLLDLFAAEDVEATVIGRFTGDGRLRLRYQGTKVADLSMAFLHGGLPRIRRKATWSPPHFPEPHLPERDDYGPDLKAILAAPNVCSKEWIVRQYDHEVQGGSVIKPLVGATDDGPGDAAVLTPVLGSLRGVALACGFNPKYGDIDPYEMAAGAIDEALRNITAVGGSIDRVALLDNFCWGNTDKPDRLGGLVRAAQACYDIASVFQVPFISGKDSLNNEFATPEGSVAIPPSLLISAIGVIEDVRHCITADAKQPGNLVYVVGLTRRELGGSHYWDIHGAKGECVPRVDAALGRRLMLALHEAIRQGLVRAAHDMSEGGLAVAAAEMAFAGGLGMRLHLNEVLHTDDVTRADEVLFSESHSRFLVEVAPENREAFERTLAGLPAARIGEVTDDARLRITGLAGRVVIDASVADLKEAWQAPLRW